MTNADVKQSMEVRLLGVIEDYDSASDGRASDGRSEMIDLRVLKRQILDEFMDLLLDLAPPKEDALDALSAAIDIVFAAASRPILTSIVKPGVKSALLAAADKLYDAVFADEPTATGV